MMAYKGQSGLTGQPLEAYHQLSGIWGMAKDFSFELLPSQVQLIRKLYISLTTATLNWDINHTDEMIKSGKLPDAQLGLKELKRSVKIGSNFISEKDGK
jgi:hypothetical protein